VGFFIGDLALFQAFVLIGARLSLLVMCLAPPLTALLGLAFLHETLAPAQVAGMALAASGVAWTVAEGSPAGGPRPAPRRLSGALLALVGAIGQAGGLVLSKVGMEQLDDPFAASQIRGLAGIVGFSVLFTVAGWWPRVASGLRDARGLLLTGTGAFCGPFLGVSLSLLAIHEARAGVAAAIMSVSPVLILPIAHLRGERVTPRAVLGTLVAVAGVVVLFNAGG
jgi:drug/metabolite transporter (DMT)-like permease